MLLSVLLIAVIALLKKGEGVAEFGDCTGGKKCDSGLNCYAQTQYYSQCLTACPEGWQCSTGGGVSTTAEPATATTSKSVGTTTRGPSTSNGGALTNDCSFGFGAAFDGNSRDYSQVDYATIWIGTISS